MNHMKKYLLPICLAAGLLFAETSFAKGIFLPKEDKEEATSPDNGDGTTIVSNGKRVFNPETNEWVTPGAAQDNTNVASNRRRGKGFAGNDSCSVYCSTTSGVVVDVSTRCMCTGPGKCFTVQTSPRNTSNTTKMGTGRITADVAGAKFQTHTPARYSSQAAYTAGLTDLNNDALRMGIPANDGVGRWIHKAYNCGPGGIDFPAAAKPGGCIGVPCHRWPQIKAKTGSTFHVCNSAEGVGGNRRQGATNGTR